MQGTEMLLQEAEDRRKAMAEELNKARRRIGALEDDRVRLIEGMAEMFPASNWTIRDDVDFDQATKETVSSVLSQVRHLQEALKGAEEARLAGEKKLAEVQGILDETRQAAGVAIAMQTMRAATARGFLDAEVMAAAWFDSYCDYWNAKGNPSQVGKWSDLNVDGQAELIAIAERVRAKFDAMHESKMNDLDGIAAELLAEGDVIYNLVQRMDEFAVLLRNVWSDVLLPTIRRLHALGIDFIPPGTIVHGVTASNHPHRPD